MSKNTKIIIGVIAGLLVLCLILCVAGVVIFNYFGKQVASSVSENPEAATQKQAAIAELDLPERFAPASTFSVLGIDMVIYETGGTNEVALLMQMPVQGEIDDSMFKQLQEGMQRGSNRNFSNVKVVETREIVVRGRPARVVIQEGTTDEGQTMRMMLTAFQGSGGISMLMFMAPPDVYDQAEYDAVVESIR